jgi:hypothetical protein
MVSNLMTNKQIPFEKMEPPFCFGMTKPYNHYGATIIIMEWSDHNGLGNRPLNKKHQYQFNSNRDRSEIYQRPMEVYSENTE